MFLLRISYFSIVLVSLVGFCQGAVDLNDMALEDLMEVKVSVATETSKSLREAPGIITVITDEQIKSLGARDLKEVLESVPGITFGHDVLGNISIIMRGIWAQEGRILLLIDGLEMNERSYGTILISNHYPAEHIKRVEVIRGPGSAIYGGFAELGVINITTKHGADLKGGSLSSTYSRTSKDFANNTNNFMIGQTSGNLSASVKGMVYGANFSDRNYVDENGVSANLGNGNSKIGGAYLNTRVNYRSFYFNSIRDDHKTENVVLWGDLENSSGAGVRRPVPKNYLTDTFQLGFQDYITNDFNLHMYYSSKNQLPYYQPDTKNEVEHTNSWRRQVERKLYGLKIQYDLNSKAKVNAGLEHSQETSHILNRLNHNGTPDVFGHNNSDVAVLRNSAAFAQFDVASSFANFTGGIRYDKPSAFNDTFVPRLGLTKVMGKSHVKALYAKAFRAPVIENISLNDDIKPEISTTGEMEYGYQFDKNKTLRFLVFSTNVKDIIVYSYDSGNNTEHYNNYDHVSTLGGSAEFQIKQGIHDGKISLFTYKVDSLEADPFKSSENSSALIGSPKYKLYLSDTIRFSEKFELTPSATLFSGIYGYAYGEGSFSEKRLEDILQVRLFANYKDLFFQGLEVGAGINNLLNNNIYYSQPYVKEGDYKAGPYPGLSREYVLRIAYSKEFE